VILVELTVDRVFKGHLRSFFKGFGVLMIEISFEALSGQPRESDRVGLLVRSAPPLEGGWGVILPTESPVQSICRGDFPHLCPGTGDFGVGNRRGGPEKSSGRGPTLWI
jgi:hypothetical protein